MFKGTYTALITPMNSDGSVDYGALEEVIESQIQGGVKGLIPMGSTGESPTFNHEEHIEIIGKVMDFAKGRVQIIAGTGSNSTREALDLTQKAKDMGVSASLQVAPYYNKPSQEGFYRHFMSIADQVDLPMILYNIPGRSGKNIEVPTILKLASHSNIKGIKEASGNLSQISDIIQKRPKDFVLLSGDDNLTYPILALGGEGVISVSTHLLPEKMGEMVTKALNGDLVGAREIHFHLMDLFKAMFLDTNPIPVKTALALQGRIQEVFRLPLCSMGSTEKEKLTQVLQGYNLLP